MNILVDELDAIVKEKIGNIKINTDFRISILFELLMQDNTVSKKEKILQSLQLYYPDLDKIKDFDKAIQDMLWFYRCGKELADSKENNIVERNKQIYSYEFDDDKIYSAFMEQYNIDLQDIKYLHWWKFKALFNALSENTQFVKIMGYRAMNVNEIKDKKMKKQYRKLQKMYALPDMRTEEEKEYDFGEAFS
jgi:hypothetical protein